MITISTRRICAYLLVLAGTALSAPAAQLLAWPAEPEENAANLSKLSRDFRKDLSGAVWNPHTRTLWLCRNGPGSDSKLWVLEEDDQGALRIGSNGGRRGEWGKLGDSEGVTFADFEEQVVYLIVEGEEKIHELDVSTYGKKVVKQVYDTSPFLPLAESAGAEGITFVPDEHLTKSGFVDSSGSPRVSREGMGGLMLVGHQNGGGIYAFDLNRKEGTVAFVGEYRIFAKGDSGLEVLSRVAALEFDRSTGMLYVWHGLDDANILSVADLCSQPVLGESFREFHNARSYRGPSARNYEGIALVPSQYCDADERTLFLTVDDGKKNALFRYDGFRLGCEGVRTEEDGAPDER